jgi:hypothetical protein
VRRLKPVAVLALVCLLLVGGLWVAFDRGVTPWSEPDGCTASVDGRTVHLSVEQGENAATIAAVAVGRKLPARAVTIALATAYQESKIRNLDHGDRDSLGLFQQRPSQGWGSAAEVQDPVYAANAFYDELERIGDYRSMEVTVAAQKVQRSAYPDAYGYHEADARVLASALTGNSAAAFSCTVSEAPEPGSSDLSPAGLTVRAERMRTDATELFGSLSTGGFAPGGVSSGHMKNSAHYSGRAVDFFFRPISADNKVRGWALAHWAVANASRLGISTVIFDGRIWHAGSRSEDGWTTYRVPSSSSGDRRILEHRDHVHVDVA